MQDPEIDCSTKKKKKEKKIKVEMMLNFKHSQH